MEETQKQDSELDVDAQIAAALERLTTAQKMKEALSQEKLKNALLQQEKARAAEEAALHEQRRKIAEIEEKWAAKKRATEETEARERAEKIAENIRLQVAVQLAEAEQKFKAEQAARVKRAVDAAFLAEQEANAMLLELNKPAVTPEPVDKSQLSVGTEQAASGLEMTADELNANVRQLLRLPALAPDTSFHSARPVAAAPQPDPYVVTPIIRTNGKLHFVDSNELDKFLKIAKADLGFPLNYNRVAALATEFMVLGVAEAYSKMTKTRGCSHDSILGALEYTLRNPEPEIPVAPAQTIVPGPETVDTVIEPMTEDEALFSSEPEETESDVQTQPQES